MRGKANARAIGPAAQVRAAEGAGAVPSGGDHVRQAQTACGNLGLDGGDIVAGRTRRDRVLPDQILLGHVRADVAGLGAEIAMRQFEPCAGKAILEIGLIRHELFADGAIGRVHLHRHVGIGHHRHDTLGRVGCVNRHILFLDADGLPLLRACRGSGEFPVIAEQQFEIAHVPLGRIGGPSAFDARGDGIGGLAAEVGVDPAKALRFEIGGFGCIAQSLGIAIAMRLADGMTAAGQSRSFLVVHGHAGKGLADLSCGLERIRLTVHALGVHIDQAHLHGGEGVFHGGRVLDALITAVTGGQPFLFRAPIGVFLGVPDIFAAKGEAKGFEAHGFIGHVACEQDQVGPAQLVAVFLFDRPEDAARLVEVAVVGPAVERGKADVAMATAAAPIGQTVRARRMPCEADHQPAVMAPISGPPVLAVGHQRLDVGLDGLEVEGLDLFGIVEIRPERIGFLVVLVQDIEVQGLGPPIHDAGACFCHAAMHDRAFANVVAVHFRLLLECCLR